MHNRILFTWLILTILFSLSYDCHAQHVRKYCQVSGTVFDYETYPEVKLTKVSVSVGGKVYKTDSSGTFKLTLPAEDKYHLKFACPQFDTLDKYIYVSGDTVLKIDLIPTYCDYFPMKTGIRIFKYSYQAEGYYKYSERHGKVIWNMHELTERNDTLILRVKETRIDTLLKRSEEITKTRIDTSYASFEICEDKLHFIIFPQHLGWDKMSRYYKFTAPADKELELGHNTTFYFRMNAGLVRFTGQYRQVVFDADFAGTHLFWDYVMEQ